MIIRTVQGYDFFECSSAMQKAIRRADAAVAGYFALELWHSGYRDYVWKRLFTISAEDCYGIITKEIEALWQGHELVNKNKTEPKGRIFVSKAVLLLCECRKCRDRHLQQVWCQARLCFIIDSKPGQYNLDVWSFQKVLRAVCVNIQPQCHRHTLPQCLWEGATARHSACALPV